MVVFDGRHFFGHVKMAALIRHLKKRKENMAVFLVHHFYVGSRNGGLKVRHIKMVEKWEKRFF